jgi:hypothetical protein
MQKIASIAVNKSQRLLSSGYVAPKEEQTAAVSWRRPQRQKFGDRVRPSLANSRLTVVIIDAEL